MAFMVPPGGFAGFRQQAPAARHSMAKGMPRSSSGGKRRRRRKKSKYGGGGLSPVRTKGIRGRGKSPYTRRAKRASKGPKFGSPAFNKKHGVGQFARKRK